MEESEDRKATIIKIVSAIPSHPDGSVSIKYDVDKDILEVEWPDRQAPCGCLILSSVSTIPELRIDYDDEFAVGMLWIHAESALIGFHGERGYRVNLGAKGQESGAEE